MLKWALQLGVDGIAPESISLLFKTGKNYSSALSTYTYFPFYNVKTSENLVAIPNVYYFKINISTMSASLRSIITRLSSSFSRW